MARSVRSRVVDRDLGYARVLGKLRGLRGMHVVVGLRANGPGAERTAGGGPSLAQIGGFHELGAGVPARPFLGPTVDQHRTQYLELVGDAVADAIDNATDLDAGLGRIGARVAADAQHTIDVMTDPALSPATVQRKGSSALLVDTGRMRAGIDFEVRRGARP